MAVSRIVCLAADRFGGIEPVSKLAVSQRNDPSVVHDRNRFQGSVFKNKSTKGFSAAAIVGPQPESGRNTEQWQDV